jgi:hypothetical protein
MARRDVITKDSGCGYAGKSHLAPFGWGGRDRFTAAQFYGQVWLASLEARTCNCEEDRMNPSTRIIRAALLAVAAVLLAAAAVQLRDKRQVGELTVENIHEQLDALDPVTRAAVVARLSSDEVKKVRDRQK